MMIRSSKGSPFYMDFSRMFMWMYRLFYNSICFGFLQNNASMTPSTNTIVAK